MHRTGTPQCAAGTGAAATLPQLLHAAPHLTQRRRARCRRLSGVCAPQQTRAESAGHRAAPTVCQLGFQVRWSIAVLPSARGEAGRRETVQLIEAGSSAAASRRSWRACTRERREAGARTCGVTCRPACSRCMASSLGLPHTAARMAGGRRGGLGWDGRRHAEGRGRARFVGMLASRKAAAGHGSTHGQNDGHWREPPCGRLAPSRTRIKQAGAWAGACYGAAAWQLRYAIPLCPISMTGWQVWHLPGRPAGSSPG